MSLLVYTFLGLAPVHVVWHKVRPSKKKLPSYFRGPDGFFEICPSHASRGYHFVTLRPYE